MHTVWKSWRRVYEVFAKFWEGGYIGVVKILGGGYTFLVFYCIFINKFWKNFGGRVHFYPPSPPPHPLCASMASTYFRYDSNLGLVNLDKFDSSNWLILSCGHCTLTWFNKIHKRCLRSIKAALKILSCDVREHKFIICKVFYFFLLKIVLRNKTFCWMCLNVRIWKNFFLNIGLGTKLGYVCCSIKSHSFKINLMFFQIAFWSKNIILSNGALHWTFFQMTSFKNILIFVQTLFEWKNEDLMN